MFKTPFVYASRKPIPQSRAIANTVGLQTKLKIGVPNDHFEQEADATADRVTSTPETQIQTTLWPNISLKSRSVNTKPFLQRMLESQAPEEDMTEEAPEESIQTKPFIQRTISQPPNDDTPSIQPSSESSPSTTTPQFNQQLSASKGSGSPLSPETKAYMEPRFGADFSPVRIHTNQNAISMNNQISAKAFTHQNDIYFNQGQYNPDSSSGKHLLAHELTHTIQQGSAVQRKPQISTNAQPNIQRGISETLNNIVKQIPGYTLFTVIIGRNPITGDSVARTPNNFVGGFLSLLPGGTALFKKLQKTGAIENMMTWLDNEIIQLGITWSYLKRIINYIWNEVSVVNSWSTNYQIAKKHLAAPYNRLKRFVKNIINKVKEFIFIGALKVVGAPIKTVMGILNKGANIIQKIFSDPIGFIQNLFRGIKLGLNGFILRIQKHMLNGLTGWLFGSMSKAGIQMPKKFDLKGVFQLITQLLGLTYQQIRPQIVKRFGRKGETIVSTLETSFKVVQLLRKKGPIALWTHIKQSLSDLKKTVVDGIKDYLIKTVVKEGIFWILGLINPAGALLKVAKTLVNVVMFFVERFQQIVAFAKSIFDAVGKIASGDLKQAAKAVENAIAKSLPVMIGFLANLIGLGGLAKSVVNIMKRIGNKIKNVINKIIDWIVKKGKKLFKKLKAKRTNQVGNLFKWQKMRKNFQTPDKKIHKIYVEKTKKKKAQIMVASVPDKLKNVLDAKIKNKSKEDYDKAIEIYKALGQVEQQFNAISKKYNLDERLYQEKKQGRYTHKNQQGAISQEAKSAIAGLATDYYKRLSTLSDILKKYELENVLPETVKTKIEVTASVNDGMPANGKANPLTMLPGNTKGQKADEAKERIKGQDYLEIMRDIYKRESYLYHRTHVIHDRLHGPATRNNLVYAHKNLNHSFVNMEHDIIRRVYKRGEIMYFHVSKIQYNATHKWLAKQFHGQWGYMKVIDPGPPVKLENDPKRDSGSGKFQYDEPLELKEDQKPIRYLTGEKVVKLGEALGLTPPTDFATRFKALKNSSGPDAIIIRKRTDNGMVEYNFKGLEFPTLIDQYYNYRTKYKDFIVSDTEFVKQLKKEAHERNIKITLK